MRPLVLPIAILLALGAVTYFLRSGEDGGTPVEEPRASVWDVTVSTPVARTAGAEACKTCHPEEFAEWETSPHGRTGRPLATPEGGADFAIGSSWMQAYLRKDASGLHRLVPQCFDVQAQTWRDVDDVLDAIQGEIMPEEGGQRPRQTAKRSFERDCSGCHVSGTRLREDLENGRLAGGWRATSIDCEACHGPALDHVEAWERMDDSQPLADLERFDARTRAAICARCHGGSGVGSEFTAFDAEHWIAPAHTGPGVYSHGAATGQIYQADAFLRSRCHLEGDLSCTDCHEWHAPGRRHTEHADAICTRCHTDHASREHTHHASDDEGGRCIGCHMPRLLTGLLAHQRDHRISSPLPAAADAPDACTACHVEEDKAWAAQWAEEWWGPPSEITLGAVRGVQLARSGDLEAARPLLERATSHRDPFLRWAAAQWLGDPQGIAEDELPEGRLLALQLAAQREDGKKILRAGLRDPSPVLRAVAYVALAQRGPVRAEPPMEDLEIAARVSRNASEVRVVLARVYLAKRRVAQAIDLLEETVVFRKRDPDAWLVLTGAYTLARRDDAAAAAVARWSEVTDPLPHLEAFVSTVTRAGEVTLARTVFASVAKHLVDPELRSSVETRRAEYERLMDGGSGDA